MSDLILRLKRHYLPCSALILTALIVLSFVFTKRDAITFTAQSTGYISIVILTFSLIIGTINLIRQNRNPVSTYFRRDVAIIGGILAVIHSVTGLFMHLRGRSWMYFLNKTDTGYSIRLDNFGLANYTGLISSLLIVFLLITSNDLLLRKLNSGTWKNIQRSAYFMFILAIVHCLLYRGVKEHFHLVYTFYVPLVSLVLVFQMIGIWLTVRQHKNF